jgi:hypothetical protein
LNEATSGCSGCQGRMVRLAAASVAAAVVLTLAAVSLTGLNGGLQGRVEDLGMYNDDSLRLRRQRMVGELSSLRGLEGGVRQQMHQLEQEEAALKNAWQTTNKALEDTSTHTERKMGLASSAFPEAFPGVMPGETVCEPWPTCCPSGNADNCYGVVSGGVLGAHTCSPYPMCCGADLHNCFDQASTEVTPNDGAAAPSQLDISHLEAVCEGEKQLKQCLMQTQRCMSPSSEGFDTADTCTCFSSSLYCSYPQTPENCSPCPMVCQQHIYDWFKATQTEMDGSAMQCPLFEKASADEVYMI